MLAFQSTLRKEPTKASKNLHRILRNEPCDPCPGPTHFDQISDECTGRFRRLKGQGPWAQGPLRETAAKAVYSLLKLDVQVGQVNEVLGHLFG